MSLRPRSSRECRVPGCGRSIVSGSLMCPGHWHLVPAELRSEVHRTLHAYDARMLHPDIDARVAAIEAYRQAKQAAIDAVVAQLDEEPDEEVRS